MGQSREVGGGYVFRWRSLAVPGAAVPPITTAEFSGMGTTALLRTKAMLGRNGTVFQPG